MNQGQGRTSTFISYSGYTNNASSYSTVTTSETGLLVIGVGWESNSFNLSSVTVNGNAATSTGNNTKIGTIGAGMYYYNTNESSNTIAINFNGSVDRSLISCWLLKGLSSSTPTSTNGISGPSKTTLTNTATDYTNSGALGISIQSNSVQNTNITWSGATQDYGTSVEALAFFGGASFITPSPNNYNVVTTFSTSDAVNLLATWY